MKSSSISNHLGFNAVEKIAPHITEKRKKGTTNIKLISTNEVQHHMFPFVLCKPTSVGDSKICEILHEVSVEIDPLIKWEWFTRSALFLWRLRSCFRPGDDNGF